MSCFTSTPQQNNDQQQLQLLLDSQKLLTSDCSHCEEVICGRENAKLVVGKTVTQS